MCILLPAWPVVVALPLLRTTRGCLCSGTG